ncbi:MAG: Hpt domain-containing protein [Dechloromonas sp.]|nr:Hpt domain-containing protein [Dechloromonas sp.]
MNAASEFDLGPLTWVKGEIDLALERAADALGQHGLTGDPTQMRFCRTHIHQVQGALSIVGLDGVTQVIESLEALSGAVEDNRVQATAGVSATLGDAIEAIRRYLDDLIAGEPNQPLRLLPTYAALAKARGLPACNPADLFYPDITRRPPRYAAPVAPLLPEQMLTLLKSERARFQKGLLAWLKHTTDPHLALEHMHTALDNIEATQESPAARAFWWVALAFVESLFDHRGEADAESRQLLARIDTQMRRLSQGSRSVADRLMRDVLYAVALAPAAASPGVAEVQAVFGLRDLIPAAAAGRETTQPQETALRRLRDNLATAEELWNKFCTGSASALPAFEQHVQSCAALANEIGHTDLKRLGQGFGAVASWLAESPDRHNDMVAMEVATAILLLQNAQENFRRLGMDFAQQVDLMVARLYACIAGSPPGGNQELPLLDEMTRRAQEKLLVGQVAREIQTNLAQVEQALDAFFRNPEKKQDLAGLDAPVRQTAGALAMLGHMSAVALVQGCGTRIQEFARPGYAPLASDFEAVAQQLSTLGFFVDALQHGESDFDAFLRRLHGAPVPEPGEEAAEDLAAVPSVEVQLEQHKHETQSLFEAFKDAPGDEHVRTELKLNLQSLQKDADLLANPELADTAKTVLKALESGDALRPDIDAAVSSLVGAPVEAAAPSTETLELAQSSHEAIDAELLAIFLEEAHEVLATIGEHERVLAANLNDSAALTTIRRSAHTLKGSGRMVGLADMGEAAWALEQTLNMWLRQDMAATSGLLNLIGDAHQLFSRWVAALEHGSEATPDPSALVAEAERLRGEEPVPPAPPAESAVSVVERVDIPPVETEEALSFDLDLAVNPPSAGEFEGFAATEMEEIEIAGTSPEEALGHPVEAIASETAETEEPSSDMADAFADLLEEEVAELPQPAEIPAAAPTLYDIFCEEARGHLATLVACHADMDADPTALTAFDMTRAAHTLGGIAATVGLMPLHHLALALEHALLRRDGSGRLDSIEGLETVRQAIITLENMFTALARQEAPEEQVQLIGALADIYLAEAQPEPAAIEPAGVSAEEELAVALEPAMQPGGEAVTPAAPAPVVARLKDDLDEHLLPVFLEEAQDQLRELTVQLRLWRGDPASDAQPHAIARLLHTFKGNARMAGAMNLGEFTHLLEARVEDVLRAEAATPAFIDEIESGCDMLAQATERLRSGESAELDATSVLPGAAIGEAPSAVALAPDVDRDHEVETGAQRATLRVRADLIDRLVNEAGELSIARARIEGEMRSLKGSLLDLTENVIRLRRQLREIEIQAEGQIQARVAQAHDGQADFDPLELDRFTRFQELTRFMAESVNDVATVQQNLLKNLDDANAAIVAQARLNRGLQQELMGVRMMPFASQAERLFRIVRQSSKELGKRANFDIVGGQVELDRSVLDKMMAPLEHMLRNAVTHGIEARAERVAAGKPEMGDITVSLAQEGNEIILSMADDGRGLDRERIRARAEGLGLLEPGQDVEDARLYDFIFLPGFSTAGEVSQLAGRGVGMDVVKTEVAELGGRIETVSRLGQGTTFRIYLPLTLAVTQTLLARAGAILYAVPSTMIEQVLDLKEEPLAVLRARGEVEWQGNRYPFHYLPHLLGDTSAAPEAQRQYWILLLRSGSQRVAVQVDELRGNQEVVVKNIGAQLSRVVGIAGATVLGDGQVVLILNPVALASRKPAGSVESAIPVTAAPVVTTTTTAPTVMVVDDSLTVRKITGRLLVREGYHVALAKDGIDALEQLLELVPDVVISDIEMPRMDGFDLVRNIRADKRLSKLPIIMITSRTAEKHRSHALEIGASDYLGKPYDEDELLTLIAGYVRARQAS